MNRDVSDNCSEDPSFLTTGRDSPFTVGELHNDAFAIPDLRKQSRRIADVNCMLAGLRAHKAELAAEESNRRLKQLIAVVAHELRNPLAPIRSAASALTKVTPAELERLQAIIQRQVDQAAKLVADLLDVAHIDLGSLRLDAQDIDLAKIMHEAIDDCRPAIASRNQHLRLDMPAAPLPMRADGGRMMQILTNLLDNASKYTPDGGDIGISVAAMAEEVVVVVSDNGIGITRQALPHVFEAFLRDRNARDFNGAGLGIGLCVVRELVEAHGGTIAAWSDGVGQGSRFVVKLPLA